MLPEVLNDKAVQYVAGGMTEPERDSFEVLLEFHDELRAATAGLGEVAASVAVAGAAKVAAPPPDLKARILDSLASRPGRPEPEGLVVADPDGQIQWVNPGFTMMCGYTLEELKGRKPGHVLQGPETDPAAVGRIREALRSGRECRETLVNYHKNGSPYRVNVRIAPILDDDAKPLWFVARERKVADLARVGAP